MPVPKVFSISFWIIMFLHMAAFTAIGLFTGRGWGLLILFGCVLLPLLIARRLVAGYARRHPEKERLRNIMGIK